MKLTQKRLQQLLEYDPATGIFKKRMTTHENTLPIGSEVGWKNGNGYLRAAIDGHKYFLHRLAWLYVYGEMPDQIDHINRNPIDNRICNLRLANFCENNSNRGPRRSPSKSSIFKGIYFEAITNQWRMEIKFAGKHFRARFHNETDAAITYNYHAAHLHGDYAYLNKIRSSNFMHE